MREERESLFASKRLVRVMRQKWWWKKKVYWPVVRAWHRHVYDVSVPPSMLAKLGKGPYVNVTRSGPYIDIENHNLAGSAPGMIRLIPYAPNHGVMVEFWQNGRVLWRTHADYDFFTRIGLAQSELHKRDIVRMLDEMDAPDA